MGLLSSSRASSSSSSDSLSVSSELGTGVSLSVFLSKASELPGAENHLQ